MLLAAWYNSDYTLVMKTAISIPDDLFATAEQLAARFGVSRSELYVTALRANLMSRYCVPIIVMAGTSHTGDRKSSS